MTEVVGRFAPSPTGRMHLGNVAAAWRSYQSAKRQGGRWILRIEDNDPQRSKQQWVDLLLDDLRWLGLEWDEGPYFQSRRIPIYEHYLRQLASRGLLYPCHCTRAQLLSAPHLSDGQVVYDGHCRPSEPIYDYGQLEGENLRLRVPLLGDDEDIVQFEDRICGHQHFSLSRDVGDFLVRRRDGAIAYQFATAVDDLMMGVTEIVRGDDLLRSTVPQRYIQNLLMQLPLPAQGLLAGCGQTSLPLPLALPSCYSHFPLLRNADGQRLSKRDHSQAMDQLRQLYTPQQILAMCSL